MAWTHFSDDDTDSTQREVVSVSQLNRHVRQLLEGNFPGIWVEGEISNFVCPASGHFYFSLKDDKAQLRCAMFRNRNMRLPFRPKDGMQVMVRGSVSLYEARGEYQLIVEQMEEAGAGALQRAFEALKKKLAGEGLFDSQFKKPLPDLPQCVGVITSATGAAVRDVLKVLNKRFPALPVVVYPSAVQGEEAPRQLIRALQTANDRAECDVLLLVRGGGSLEDLWAFNDETLARAIFASDIPVVSGVGHEIDFTIADFVADLRCPTPSSAAEHVSPDRDEWLARLQHYGRRLAQQTRALQLQFRSLLKAVSHRLQLQHPRTRIQQRQQHLDQLAMRIQREINTRLTQQTHRLDTLQAKLAQHNPMHVIRQRLQHRSFLQTRLQQAMQKQLAEQRQHLQGLAHALNVISPLATLERGYAIVHDKDRQILRDANQVKPGEQIEAKLHKGSLICTVEQNKS